MKNYDKILYLRGFICYDFEKSQPTERNKELVGRMLVSFSSLGYTLSPSSMVKLSKCDDQQLTDFYNYAFQIMNEMKGTSISKATVFYKNFPNLDDLSEGDFLFKAELHYFTVMLNDLELIDSDQIFINQFEKVQERIPEELKNVNYKVLDIVDSEKKDEIICSFFKNKFESNIAIEYFSLPILKQIYKDYWDRMKNNMIPNTIPFKENMVQYIKMITPQINKETVKTVLFDSPFIKTATDVLRVYTIFSNPNFYGGELEVINYKSFSRSVRRVFLCKLDVICHQNPFAYDDFYKYKYHWIYVFENLHPGDYSRIYPSVYGIATDLRDSTHKKTYNGKLEIAYKRKDWDSLIKLYSIKPGYFARALDRLLRVSANEQIIRGTSQNPEVIEVSEEIINAFAKVADKVSIPVLLQLYEYFKFRNLEIINRKTKNIDRVFIVKQKTLKSKETRNIISTRIISLVLNTILEAINKIAATKEKITKVYVEESCKNYSVPSNNREMSENFAAAASGSKIEIGETNNCIRFFTHWKNVNSNTDRSGRVDVDLAIHFLDANYNCLGELSWRDHYVAFMPSSNCSFSGDVTNAPKGASEYIDVRLNGIKQKCKYVLSTNTVYTDQTFEEIPECFSGVMFRENLGKAGEIYDPRTVETKFDLKSKSKCNYGFIYDVESNVLINVDRAVASGRIAGNNTAAISEVVKKYTREQFTLYDLIMAESSMFEFVETKEEAEVIIGDSEEATIKAYEQEKLSNLLL